VITSKEDSAARVGSYVAEKWRLEELIAHGSVAATYKATHRNGLTAAIKIVHRSHSQPRPVVERYFREAHLANRVRHPGVERVFDDGTTDDGCPFLIMEYLEGVSLELHRVSAGGKLLPADAQTIVDRLLDVLVAIHGAGVVHRNLKPSNVFLTTEGRLVLTDFGRARFLDVDPNAPWSIDGWTSGAPAYMPPEQACGRRSEVDERSDVWATGAILFTLLSGRRVHRGRTTLEKLASAQTKRAPALAYVLPGINPALAAVVDRALAFEKRDRFPSASDMRHAFWLATGRRSEEVPAEETLPDLPPALSEPALVDPEPESTTWTEKIRRSSIPDPSLMPPPLEAFVVGEPAPRGARATVWTVGRTLLVALFVLAFLAAAATLVVLFYSKDEAPATR
jgi:eukaryotic-like serine/threonine-protein kinase